MKLTVLDLKGNPQGELETTFALIENAKGTQALHETIVAYQANQRMGTASTKTIGEVAGTGKKPWRQKGTGRARAGSFQSPLWRGGGVVFGPKPRDFGRKVPARVKQLALRKALSDRLKGGDVVIVNDLKLDSHKTKAFLAVLSALNLHGTLLIVVPTVELSLALASRNVPDVELTTSAVLNPYQVLRPSKLLFTRDAFQQVEQRLN
jgi:large subunit ribosomal protein L4